MRLNRWLVLFVLSWMILVPLGLAGAWWFVLFFHHYDVNAFLNAQPPYVLFGAGASRLYRLILTSLVGLALGMGLAYSLCHILGTCRGRWRRW